jgi:GNAT superfamily N-acetyltransferase
MTEPSRHPHIDLLQAHLECCLGSFLTGLYRRPAWFGAFSDAIQDRYWNFLIPLVDDLDKLRSQVETIGQFYDTIDQHPTLYGDEEFLADVRPHLETPGMACVTQDAWMELQDSQDHEPRDDIEITTVRTEAEKQTFLSIFDAAFGEDEPLPQTYLEGIRRALDEDWGAGVTRNILLKADGTAAGIGTVAINNGNAFLYNIATLPSHQGNGLGTAATHEAIRTAQDHGVDRIVLQAEAGSYVEDFYRDRGFETIFTAAGYHGGPWTDTA